MSTKPKIELLLPPMRLVQGSLYKANDTDWVTKKPRVYPHGHQKAGQPKIDYYFAGAIEKLPGEQAWWNTSWGTQILAFANQVWAQGQTQMPSFAWKIEDGDSMIPNRNNRKNGETEGMPGHWIVGCGTVIAPKVWRAEGGRWVEWTQVDAVLPGDCVQVQLGVASNENAQNPGIYLNPDLIVFRGYGPRISKGFDANNSKLLTPGGQQALPAWVTSMPAGGPAMPSTAGAAPGTPFAPPGQQWAQPGTPGAPPMGPTAGMAPPGAGVPFAPGQPAPGAGLPNVPPGTTTYPFNPQVPVQPSAAFIAPPGAQAAPAPYVPPAAPTGPVMTAKAQGAPWSSFQQQGWTVEAARAQGFVV